MKDSKKLKMDLNSTYDKIVMDAMNSKEFKNLRKILNSGYVTSYVGRLSDRELIGQIFHYSGKALQDDNFDRQDDFTTLHFLIMEYANRYIK